MDWMATDKIDRPCSLLAFRQLCPIQVGCARSLAVHASKDRRTMADLRGRLLDAIGDPAIVAVVLASSLVIATHPVGAARGVPAP